jgi:hypothetical protein
MIRFRCLNNLRDCLARKKMEKNLNPIQGICLIALKDPFWNNTKKNWKLSTMSECTIFYLTQQHQPSMNLITCSKCKKQDPSWHRFFTREYWIDKFSCQRPANKMVSYLWKNCICWNNHSYEANLFIYEIISAIISKIFSYN